MTTISMLFMWGTPKEKMYLNLGNEKSCLFLPGSLRLLSLGRRKPFVFDAMEEATQCAKHGYYAAGIMVFAQFLNEFGVKTPDERHEIAHELLTVRPTKAGYDRLRELMEQVADEQQDREAKRCASVDEYNKKLDEEIKQYQSERDAKSVD